MPIRKFRWIATAGLVSTLLVSGSCDTGPMEVQWSDGLNALFIGNSITMWHDTPKIVEALLDSTGVGPNNIESLAMGGWTLKDHWTFFRTQRQVEQHDWDVIVLQGSTGVGWRRDTLQAYGRLLVNEAQQMGARAAFFMRNPWNTLRGDVGLISSAYTDLARETESVLLPVAEAWGEVWRRDSTIQLYDDDVHPNEAGSYLAALVIYHHLTGRSPLGLPFVLWVDSDWNPYLLELSADEAGLLQAVAADIGGL